MLSNLNTNMKVLIGISSVAIIGIIYSLIKSFFTPNKKKMVEGQNQTIIPANGNSSNGNGGNGNGGNGNGNDYRELIGSINSLNTHMENLNKNFLNFKEI